MNAPQGASRSGPEAACGHVHGGPDLAEAGFDGAEAHREEAHHIGEYQGEDRAAQDQPCRHPEQIARDGVDRVVEAGEGNEHADGEDRAGHRVAE